MGRGVGLCGGGGGWVVGEVGVGGRRVFNDIRFILNPMATSYLLCFCCCCLLHVDAYYGG